MTNKTMIHIVVGARPNFVKVAPVLAAFARLSQVSVRLIHTGQHFEQKMSAVFFKELGLPEPDYNLGIHGGSHAQQTAKIMMAYEPIFRQERPAWVMVVGDVNSTLAAALVVKKCGGKLVHLEAGLRSRDQEMPEEINRIVVDSISDLLLTTSECAVTNLQNEGHNNDKIAFVGNVMIDSVLENLGKIDKNKTLGALDLKPKNYILVTLHRPSNVAEIADLEAVLDKINLSSRNYQVIMPVHPRTSAQLSASRTWENIRFLPPMGYLDFLALQKYALAIVTDSGGIQEESSILNVPCLTLRPNTERPITVELGTNRLVSLANLGMMLEKAISGNWPTATSIPLWDGKAADRVVSALSPYL
ncbi:UDP-N-acetylglucosamine 2-epimerase [hydrothermal vent metagenome]|uniref:UDP-N-acetylglucosamine 2-epimerase n=1 Tax=hydrothermal vent metagenome TaxID=652676 RepID=A0A3B0SXX1_9ZZZZ